MFEDRRAGPADISGCFFQADATHPAWTRRTQTCSFSRSFFLEMKQLGYVEIKTLEVHRFSTSGSAQRHHEDCCPGGVRAQPDVIFAFSSRLVEKLLKEHDKSAVPVVGFTADPITVGIITSLARPGGKVCLATEAGTEIDGKQLSLWKEIAPSSSRVGITRRLPSGQTPYGSAIRTLAGHLGSPWSEGHLPIRG